MHDAVVLPVVGVARFRARRQMLAPETRGTGRSGVLEALRVAQPAYPGLRWLMARAGASAIEDWRTLCEEGAVCKARFYRGNLGCVLSDDLGLYLDACARDVAEPGSEEQFRARTEVIGRFLATYGPATAREVSDRTGWPIKIVTNVLSACVEAGAAFECRIEDSLDAHWVRTEDVESIVAAVPLQPFVTILDCWDPVTTAQRSQLATRYGYGSSIPAYWHYILVDGEWMGAFRVHYKRRLLWIREMMLDGEIMADDRLRGEVFVAIRMLEPHPIRIDEVNCAPASCPSNRDILEAQGYRLEDVYMLREH